MTLKQAIEELKKSFLGSNGTINYIFYIDKDTNESKLLAGLYNLDSIANNLTLGQLASDNFYVSSVSVKKYTFPDSLNTNWNTYTISQDNMPIQFHPTISSQVELDCYRILS